MVIEQNVLTTKQILDNLYSKYEDFWTDYYIDNIEMWSKWKMYGEVKDLPLEEKMYRSILSSEIVLDIESKEYEDIKQLLLAMGLKFKIFDSGGKGIHFHIFFSELKSLHDSLRPYVKEFIIKKLSLGRGDLKKKDNKNLIGVEFSKHRKGIQKKLLFETDTKWYPDNQLWVEVKLYIESLPDSFEGVIVENIAPKIIFKNKKQCDAVNRLIKKGESAGQRNYGAMLIVQQLRDYCGQDFNECWEAIREYNSHCIPVKEEDKLKRDLVEQYKRKYDINCKTLKERGYCRYEECGKCPLYKDFSGAGKNKIGDEIPLQITSTVRFIKPEDGRIKIVQPSSGKLISDFTKEIAEVLKDKNTLFFRPDSKDIVEIEKIKLHHTGEEIYLGFVSMKPNRFITVFEKYVKPGYDVWDAKTHILDFKEKSMTSELAGILLSSPILQHALPQITRIFTIPIPIIYNGELTFPKRGYDERFSSWLLPTAPYINKTEMTLEEAKKIIKDMLKEFCFKSEMDFNNAVAGLLTPFLRGLFPSFSTRTPVFFYLANRERAGKDYLAGINGIVYEGYALEEPPINNSEKEDNNFGNEELRKKILSAMIAGRKRLHFSNNKGYINNAVFEGIVTATRYSDRVLGRNEILTFNNEIDFSLSGNMGVTFTADLANRCRFINLFLEMEDANQRRFEKPDLHDWIKNNRDLILSALYTLIKEWVKNGKPEGKLPFTSFPDWARVCGGVMENAGYQNPCKTELNLMITSGDSETADMKRLFELCYKKYPEQVIKKSDIRKVAEENEIFAYMELGEFGSKSDQIKFGKKLNRFFGRILSDIRLDVMNSGMQAQSQEFRFTKLRNEVQIEIFH